MTLINPSAPSGAVTGQGAKDTQAQEKANAFEAVFLSQMVDEMMKTVNLGGSMGSHAEEMWRSVMSQSLAESLAENGGLGLSQNIQNALKSYTAPPDGGSS